MITPAGLRGAINDAVAIYFRATSGTPCWQRFSFRAGVAGGRLQRVRDVRQRSRAVAQDAILQDAVLSVAYCVRPVHRHLECGTVEGFLSIVL
jgi:hypothetical protein